MKRILAFILSAAVVLSMLAAVVSAESETDEEPKGGYRITYEKLPSSYEELPGMYVSKRMIYDGQEMGGSGEFEHSVRSPAGWDSVTYEGNFEEHGLKMTYDMERYSYWGFPKNPGVAQADLCLHYPDGHVYTYRFIVTIIEFENDDGEETTDTPAIVPEMQFADVPETEWYYGCVKEAYELGIINGRSATEFSPDDNMTYAEAIKIAACMSQRKTNGSVTLENGEDNWYDTYVEYAKEHGIPWEYEDYNAKITREDFVHVFFYALTNESYRSINNITAVPDVDAENEYADEILAFYNAGILTGSDSKGTFNPSSNIKRSEVAAILSRMMDATTRKAFSLK